MALDSSYLSSNESAAVTANVTASPDTQSLQLSANVSSVSSDSLTSSQFESKVLKAERWWHTHDDAPSAVKQGSSTKPSNSQPVQQLSVTKHALAQESVVAQPESRQQSIVLQHESRQQSIVLQQESNQQSIALQQESSQQYIVPQQAMTQESAVAQQELRHELRAGLIQAFDLRRNDVGALSESALKAQAQACVADLLDKRKLALTEWQRNKILKLVVDEAIGLGVLEDLLEDAAITEIMVNRFDEIYIEANGKLSKHALQFSSEQAVRSVIERIVYPLGRRIDEASPMVDARLPDGSRVNAVLPPIAVNGASFTIRKFPKKRLQMQDLVSLQALPAPLAGFLRLCVERRLNILVSGGTGSGKTTLLNVLAGFVDPAQRIVTIEDCAELLIVHPHVVTLEARQANSEGQGAITIRDLVKNALRMRPDRIVIGEVRSAEAIDMLAAMNTGHDGSITTLHANSPRDALSRLETMVLSGNAGLPLQAIREQIGSALQLVVQQTRLANGRRVITGVAEITGMESGTIQTQQLARFDVAHQRLRGAGLRPSIFEQATDHTDPAIVNWFLQT
jgi:pilus assembly protein CpaF